jgi:hypothetical protein
MWQAGDSSVDELGRDGKKMVGKRWETFFYPESFAGYLGDGRGCGRRVTSALMSWGGMAKRWLVKDGKHFFTLNLFAGYLAGDGDLGTVSRRIVGVVGRRRKRQAGRTRSKAMSRFWRCFRSFGRRVFRRRGWGCRRRGSFFWGSREGGGLFPGGGSGGRGSLGARGRQGWR